VEHKGYLGQLAARGVPVVPTVWVSRDEDTDLRQIMADQRWHDVVAKPVVGAGSFLTDRVTDPTSAGAQELWARLREHGEVMVQPYLKSVEGYGERSIIWIDGEFTHAVRKSPRLGDAQEDVSAALEIAADERALAAAVLAKVTGGPVRVGGKDDLLYARVDLIRDDWGSPLLAELELVEPSLFLLQSQLALQRLVAAIASRA